MKKFNDLALYAATKSKMSYDALTALEIVFNEMTELERDTVIDALAVLYRVNFKPVKPLSKHLDNRSWHDVLKHFVAGKKECRQYLQYVYVDHDGVAAASAGHYLVYCQTEGVEPGFYHPVFGTKMENFTYRYPNFLNSIDRYRSPHLIDVNLSYPDAVEIAECERGKSIQVYVFSGKKFDGRYVNLFAKHFGHDCVVKLSGDSLLFESARYHGVILCRRK